jgi:hypothetical protein
MKKVTTSSGKGDDLSQQQATAATAAPSLHMEYNTQQLRRSTLERRDGNDDGIHGLRYPPLCRH